MERAGVGQGEGGQAPQKKADISLDKGNGLISLPKNGLTIMWKKLRAMFRRNVLPEWFYKKKRVDVYFNSRKGILIATTHHDLNGFPGSGDPMVLLPIDANENEIGEFILQSMPQGRFGLSVHELDEVVAKKLSLAGSKRFRDLEKEWEQILVTITEGDDLLFVIPLHREKDGSFSALETDQIRCSLAALDIGRAIRCIVDGLQLSN